MTINDRSDLFSLLEICSDNKAETRKVQDLSDILFSAEYKNLSGPGPLQKPFLKDYSIDELERLDNGTLLKRKALLKRLVVLQAALPKCIRSGNGPTFSGKDAPELTSWDSVSELIKKISLSSGQTNYSNINDEDALLLFDDATVTNAQQCLDLLPVSVSKGKTITEQIISRRIGNVSFCVNVSELEAIHSSFLKTSEKGEHTVAVEKKRRVRHRLFKTAVVLLGFGSVFACRQFGILPDAALLQSGAAVSAASIIYLALG